MSTADIMTVSEAASFASVTAKSIYYHLNISQKLYPIFKDNQTWVRKSNLMELYPASGSGSKQRLTNVRATRESVINQLTNLINQEMTSGNMEEATRLFELAKFI